jgi:hypothetical protein
MIRHPLLRAVVGAVLGACAGLSLCLSILPMVLHQASIGDEAVLALRLSHFMPHVALIWAVGGWAVSRTRVVLGGGLVLATTGLGAGLFLMFAALHPTPKILAVGGVTGLVYGFLGGLLLGRILAPIPEDPEEDG